MFPEVPVFEIIFKEVVRLKVAIISYFLRKATDDCF